MLGLTAEEHEACVVTSAQRDINALPSSRDFYKAAAVRLDGADLSEARLDGVSMVEASAEGADLMAANLSGADLSRANFTRAQLHYSILKGASTQGVNFVGANLSHSDARGCFASEANLVDAHMLMTDLRGAALDRARLGGAVLNLARFDGATSLSGIQLVEPSGGNHDAKTKAKKFASIADIDWGNANLAVVSWTQLVRLGEETGFRDRLRRKELRKARDRLATVDARLKELQPVERLQRVERDYMEGDPLVPRANLTDEELVAVFKEMEEIEVGSPFVEEALRLGKTIRDNTLLGPSDELESLVDSARAYKQLATVLRAQGLTSEARRFMYSGLVLERRTPRLQRRLFRTADDPVVRGRLRHIVDTFKTWLTWTWRWFSSESRILTSYLLDLVCGYGYKLKRACGAYAAIVLIFAGLYSAAGMKLWPDAIVFSVTSFHGRGFAQFLTPLASVTQTQAVEIAAAEAIIGLVGEVVLVATIARRLFES